MKDWLLIEWFSRLGGITLICFGFFLGRMTNSWYPILGLPIGFLVAYLLDKKFHVSKDK